MDERKISGMILGSKFPRKLLTERGHSYKPCLRTNGSTSCMVICLPLHTTAGRFSGWTIVSSPTTSSEWELRCSSLLSWGAVTSRHPPGNLASTGLPGKHPGRTKKRRLGTHCPNHNSKHTWMSSGGDPPMTPAYENHGTHPCEGLGQWFSTLGHTPLGHWMTLPQVSSKTIGKHR